jgi:hypothetical protein
MLLAENTASSMVVKVSVPANLYGLA